ncbi:glycosyltransferase family 2 protein [Parafrankia sp. BMG5.11]|uniref:glycosyltransferase family 2 protein n=1 Tax=Parafrankia sp. BMG5.11 TaxID=222540 RepID=UPI0014048085|nr:glycosyltransferase family 2 protein [Parafrankia sp. BMG5.11]
MTVILIPAHNEEGGIGSTVSALRAHVSSPVAILVVADNCSDRTAELAREAGAEVVQRQDPDRRGKGYALAFGRDHLEADPPAVVIVLDADCALAPGSAERLMSRVLETGEPAQAINLVVAGRDASPIVQVSNFAMVVKNLVRARGLQRLGGGVFLFGTGMAFPWQTFAEADLATSDVVEDMQLGLALARNGVRVHLEEGARVTSAAAALADSAGQRRRWEHGFLETACKDALPLISLGLAQRSKHLLSLGAHLLVPPLALLFLVAFFLLVTLSVCAVVAGIMGPAILLGCSIASALIFVLLAWITSGRDALSPRALLSAPVYVLWKFPIYVGFFTSRQVGWNRTRRNSENAVASDTKS